MPLVAIVTENGDACALASVSSEHPGFANEDVRLSNEGWIYSFWARRYADGSFEGTAALLEAIRRTLLF